MLADGTDGGERVSDGAARAFDVRFLSPDTVRTIATVSPAGLTASLHSGITVVDSGTPADLVVGSIDEWHRAVALGAGTIVLDGQGRAGRAGLRRAGYQTSIVMALGGRRQPRLLAPVRPAAPLAYRLGARDSTRSELSRQRARVVARLPVGALACFAPLLTVATRTARQPRLLAAIDVVASDASWYLQLGTGDDLVRSLFYVFPDGEPDPALVVKFARLPDHSAPFAAESAAASTLERRASVSRRMVPRLLASGVIDDVPYSVEEAATGRQLSHVLVSSVSRARKLQLVERVASWILELGYESAGASDDGTRAIEVVLERARGSRWEMEIEAKGAPSVPAVVAHNDLGCWNILTDGSEFRVVDWESSCYPGVPLWDLLYFLTDALATIVAGEDDEARGSAAVDLLTGKSELSAVLFDGLRVACGRLGIHPREGARLATLCWIHHGVSADLRQVASTSPAREVPYLSRLVEVWMRDRRLGWSWPAFDAT